MVPLGLFAGEERSGDGTGRSRQPGCRRGREGAVWLWSRTPGSSI